MIPATSDTVPRAAEAVTIRSIFHYNPYAGFARCGALFFIIGWKERCAYKRMTGRERPAQAIEPSRYDVPPRYDKRVTKADIVDSLANEFEMSKRQVNEMVD
ncbi:MAG: hypothetical protein JO225_02140, partial [Candidatus Eremiobacteraeota bacterium]|nr:hypothetical protein [Candidatus Eremiobacteraeota bacterium]